MGDRHADAPPDIIISRGMSKRRLATGQLCKGFFFFFAVDNRLIVGHALEGVASVEGVETGLAEAGRTALDLETMHEACEVPGSLSLSRVDSRRAGTLGMWRTPSVPGL